MVYGEEYSRLTDIDSFFYDADCVKKTNWKETRRNGDGPVEADILDDVGNTKVPYGGG